MDKVKRKVAAECLRLLIDYKAVHNLWRVHSVWFEGLTPKERAYLKQCQKELEETYAKIAKLQHRLNRTA